MRKIQCESCVGEFPQNETFCIAGQTFCETCAEQRINAEGAAPLQEDEIVRNLDPTVCVWCKTDGAQTEYELLVADQPTCEACNSRLRNRPFPKEIKVSFAVLLAVAAGSFLYNYRFIDALISMRQAREALQTGNAARAADLWERVARLVPEKTGFADQAELTRGLAHMADDHPELAIPFFKRYVHKHPKELRAQTWLLRAQVGIAFDNKNYQEMWDRSWELVNKDRKQGQFRMLAASAAACLYATTGEEVQLRNTEELISEARERGLKGPEADKSENRIRHRLTTREIIRSYEFDQRFPNGWKDEAKVAE